MLAKFSYSTRDFLSFDFLKNGKKFFSRNLGRMYGTYLFNKKFKVIRILVFRDAIKI